MAQPAQRRYITHSAYAQMIPPIEKTDKAMVPFKRRDSVISEIGIDNLDSFEMWAFPFCRHEMIYNDEIHFHWSNAHSTKIVPEDPDQAINTIIKIWRSRFASDASSLSSEIDIEPFDEWNSKDFGD
jgi:hypothetical protein